MNAYTACARHIARSAALLVLTACGPAAVAPAPTLPATVVRPTGAATATPSPMQAHDFSLPSLTGEQVALHALRGRWVLVNFWATWCNPCREEMPYLQALAERHAADLVVLSVNMRESSVEVQPFVDQFGITFPILLQPDDAMLLEYAPRGLPLTYVVAPDGAIALIHYGALQPQQFDAWLAEHLP